MTELVWMVDPIFFCMAAAILTMAAASDWRCMRISNRYSLALIVLFAIGACVPDSIFNGIHMLDGLAAAGMVFVVSLLFFLCRIMGGGDTKLATATALLLGVQYLPLFLLIMAGTGGILAVIALIVRKQPQHLPQSVPPLSWLGQLKSGANKVPYGLAIAAGGMAALAAKWLDLSVLS